RGSHLSSAAIRERSETADDALFHEFRRDLLRQILRPLAAGIQRSLIRTDRGFLQLLRDAWKKVSSEASAAAQRCVDQRILRVVGLCATDETTRDRCANGFRKARCRGSGCREIFESLRC